ncbi:MAG: signal peptidase I [Candidatus Chaera renei]|uniref:Signal peptidase I n=1 Tax=Candidatus Chaera renei TaxID=2506947 RepID=A0A4Q0AKA9_9BACT|nr:MAG: signal peptidase I [Candidatus Chaera renei]
MKDFWRLTGFLAAIVIGALLVNALVFRSFAVNGPSMQTTLFTGDRLIVNRLPITWSLVSQKPYLPARGQIVVFTNPNWRPGLPERYIVKRVIGLPGERVLVSDGKITVFNHQKPYGFNPDNGITGPTSPTSGNSDTVVPPDQIYVAGDHRQDGFSLDSRNGLGTVPLSDLQGPAVLRFWPITQLRLF